MNDRGPGIIPFNPRSPFSERREALWIGPLSFRPRRESDYAWTACLAAEPEKKIAENVALFLAVSLCLHAVTIPLLKGFSRGHAVSSPYIEVDLTSPYELVPNVSLLLSRPVRRGKLEGPGKALRETTPLPQNRSAEPDPVASQPTTHPQTSGGGTVAPKSEEARHGSESGVDTGGAEYALISLTVSPRLINADQLQGLLRQYYPEAERQARHEGRVTVEISISVTGEVVHAAVVQSGGAFDQAALKIVRLLRFIPGRIGAKAVPVRLRQSILFRLNP